MELFVVDAGRALQILLGILGVPDEIKGDP
jgi:hypothetical protein